MTPKFLRGHLFGKREGPMAGKAKARKAAKRSSKRGKVPRGGQRR